MSGLSDENASIRLELTDLREQVSALAAAAALQLEAQLAQGPRAAVPVDATPPTEMPAGDVCTQTDFAEDAAAREETAHWQQQLLAVSDWLQTGAALLQDAPGMGRLPPPLT